MKRLCTTSEKELLLRNKGQMLTGIYDTASRNRWSKALIGIIVDMAIFFSGLYFVTEWFDGSKLALWAWFFIAFSIPSIIVSVIANSLRVKKETKEFLGQDRLMVNGATIVVADEASNRLAYIEDDCLDESGEPIIFDYPAAPYSVKAEMLGKRVIVMYADSDNDFQLIAVNDELRNLIPNYSEHYPLMGEICEYQQFLHPNMRNVDEGHELSEGEKEAFASMYVKAVQDVAFKMVKVSGVVLFVSIIVLCVALSFAEDGYPITKTLPIGLAVFIGLCLFFVLMKQLGKVNIRRQAQFVHVKEVVFKSYRIVNNNASVYVYEWENGVAKECEYPAGNVYARTKYGSVIYKFINQKGKPVLINPATSGKKQH